MLFIFGMIRLSSIILIFLDVMWFRVFLLFFVVLVLKFCFLIIVCNRWCCVGLLLMIRIDFIIIYVFLVVYIFVGF